MAAGTVVLRLSNGQTLNVLQAAGQAVGTSPAVNLEGTAVAGNSSDFMVKSNCSILDEIATTSATGQMEVYNVTKGIRTGRFIDCIAANYAVTVPNRSIPRIGFQAGQVYRFIQTVLQS